MPKPYSYDLRQKVIQVIELDGMKKKVRRRALVRGGYLDHRRNTPIGIQGLWQGWLKLQKLCEGWQPARET